MEEFDLLYLEGSIKNDQIWVPSKSLVTLFTLQCCQNLNVKIIFTCNSYQNNFPISLKNVSYTFNYVEFFNCPKHIQNCELPAVDVLNEPWVIVGLSASLRHFLKLKANTDSNHLSCRLLGFRWGCLQACAEVSVWTKFCEVDVVEMLNKVYFRSNLDKEFTLPQNIIRYEYHLQRPPILHNALKRKQENLEQIISDKTKCAELKKKKLKELPDLEHKYAEGIDLTLADVLLYACFSLCFYRLSNIIDFKKFFPLVHQWLSRLDSIECIARGKELFQEIFADFSVLSSDGNLKVHYPSVPQESLYKSDPERYKPRWRSFTHQTDIDEIVSKLENNFTQKIVSLHLKDIEKKNMSNGNSVIHPNINLNKLAQDVALINISKNTKELTIYTIDFEEKFKWKVFPQAVNPSDGELPLNRLQRKCQQLESMAQVIIALAKDGDKIVDFCAGGGHLGILLAFLLPNCQILLVENKKTSLDKAYKRVKSLKLANVYFYQCNLDYFNGKFDIGVCLHACGVATDLMMQKCIFHKAAFVCCPCCYGSVQPNHILSYPRSSYFSSDLKITLSSYLTLGHAADQTHGKDNPKTEQGKKCMQYVDYDRLLAAQNAGYITWLTIMNPPECTPKNHILIGVV